VYVPGFSYVCVRRSARSTVVSGVPEEHVAVPGSEPSPVPSPKSTTRPMSQASAPVFSSTVLPSTVIGTVPRVRAATVTARSPGADVRRSVVAGTAAAGPFVTTAFSERVVGVVTSSFPGTQVRTV
jgi:hypothetical protein